MAGDSNVNGNYGSQQPYGQQDDYSVQAANPGGAPAGLAAEPHSSMPTSGAPAVTTQENSPSKEEIGWYFVEQYYKTLCNEPTKLHLFYNKRSQFVAGDEAEKVHVAVGAKAITERIKQLDIQDCKVRVLNVDSQESLKNILVHVIGEMSNKAAPHRKFVQAFVLAEQSAGYYVLNDVFRYIALDDEEEYENGAEANEEVTQSAVATKPDTTTLTSSDDRAQQKADVEAVDRKLEEDVLQKPSGQDNISSDATTNGQSAAEAPEIHAEDAPVAAMKKVEAADAPSQTAAVDEESQGEKPRDPEPTPVASSPQPAKAVAAPVQASTAPPKPAAPKTWASLVGRAAPPTATNGTAPAPAAAPAQIKPKTTNAAAKQTATTPATNSDEYASKAQQNGNSGWQLANDKQRQSRPHSQSVSSSQATVLGYVKNVTDKVDASLLKAKLQTFGELIYFDVSRQKNCAFIEYADSAAYNAAVSANPHNIGGEQILVEERRPRANAYGGNFSPNRGGMRGGRGGSENQRPNNQGRGGFNKDGGRGGFNGRGGRGGAVPPKARTGQPQAA